MWHCVLSFFQNKTCVQTLEGHAQNVSCVSFHPELPIIITGSEDGNFGFSGVERTGKELRGELLWWCGCSPDTEVKGSIPVFPQARCGSGTPARTAWRAP